MNDSWGNLVHQFLFQGQQQPEATELFLRNKGKLNGRTNAFQPTEALSGRRNFLRSVWMNHKIRYQALLLSIKTNCMMLLLVLMLFLAYRLGNSEEQLFLVWSNYQWFRPIKESANLICCILKVISCLRFSKIYYLHDNKVQIWRKDIWRGQGQLIVLKLKYDQLIIRLSCL